MNYRLTSMHQLYRWRQKIEKLSERERILALLMAMMVIAGLWYLILFSRQLQNERVLEAKIQSTQLQTQQLKDLYTRILNLIKIPQTAVSIGQYKQLEEDLQQLQNNINSYQQHSISDKDLSTLLYDIVKKTSGVHIENFSTIEEAVVLDSKTAMQVPESKQYEDNNTLNHKNYRLVLSGTYFQIMAYLKNLEGLSWKLYWDKFDYKVLKYPEAVVQIQFYTLQPKSESKQSIVDSTTAATPNAEVK